MSNTSSRPSLARVWVEAPVIVVSILLAFSLEAAWQRHQDRSATDDYIAAMITEFRESQTQLDSVLTKNERALEATERMLDLTRSDVDAMTLDEASVLYWEMMQASTFDPSLGALHSFQASTAIDGLEDIGVRAALDAWPGIVEDSREDTEPVLTTSITTVDAWARAGMTPLMMDIARGTGDTHAVKTFLTLFVADEVGKNQLASRGSYLFLYQTELMGVAERLASTLALLEAYGAGQ